MHGRARNSVWQGSFMAKKRIVLTGGGTAGHVTPNIALIERLLAEGWEVHYIGTADGMERALIEGMAGVTYHAISAGKIRRYLAVQNLLDPFRVLRGIGQSRKIIKKIDPDVVFSKGGYVSVPVVIGAGKTHVVAHESDYTPGLANRIASRFSDTVCVTFEDTLRAVRHSKGVFTGTPIRPELYGGERERALRFTGLAGKKPVLLVMGGSQGAAALNGLVAAALPALLARFDIVHLCGKGKRCEAGKQPGYVEYEFIDKELPDLFALADIVLSRAGANAVFEFLALAKPALLVPLPLSASRGDQIQNAAYMEKKGYAMTLEQETATPQTLVAALDTLYRERTRLAENMRRDGRCDGTDGILAEIYRAAGEERP